MKKKRFSTEPIVAVLKQAELGAAGRVPSQPLPDATRPQAHLRKGRR